MGRKRTNSTGFLLCASVIVLLALLVGLPGVCGFGVTHVTEQHVCRHCGAHREVRSVDFFGTQVSYRWSAVKSGPYRAIHFGVFGRPGRTPCTRHSWFVAFSSGRGSRNWDGPAG